MSDESARDAPASDCPTSDEAMSNSGIVGSLSVVGLLSLCCLGFGGIAGAAALAGGGASTTAIATGATTARGALISGVVTFGTVLVVSGVGRWWLRRRTVSGTADTDQRE